TPNFSSTSTTLGMGSSSETRSERRTSRLRSSEPAVFDNRGLATLPAIAGSVGIHPAHLARVFRQFHGCAMADFVRKLRIEYACRRLTTSDAPLAGIALAAGFSDQSHFSNTFKRWMGMTPAAFRMAFAARKSDATRGSDHARS